MVDRPFVGLDNYVDGAQRPRRAPVVPERRDLPGHQRPAHGGAGAACWPRRSTGRSGPASSSGSRYYVPYVTASVAVVAVWLFLFSNNGLVNQLLGPLAPDPSWLVNKTLAMPLIALFVTWKQLGFFILLYLAALQEVPQGALRVGVDGRRGQVRRQLHERHRPRRPARRRRSSSSWRSSPAPTCSPSPTCSPTAADPTGPRRSPVLVMYQKGIEQGNPDIAAAIGVILVIGVLIIALDQQAHPGEGLRWHRPPPTADVARRGVRRRSARRPEQQRQKVSWPRMVLLALGAVLFLFPFYYMVIGVVAGGAGHVARPARSRPAASRWTTTARSTTASTSGGRWSTPASSPAAVILCTVVFGLLAGYALARAALPRPRHAVRGDAAGAGRPVPAADDPALRDDRPRATAWPTPTSA